MKEEFNGEIIEYDFYGFENAQAAEEMKKGKIGKLIGIGNSMTPILKSRQPVICVPLEETTVLKKGDIVFCKVKGNYYLHKIHGIKGKNEQEKEKQDSEIANARKSQVGSGDRSEKIRTYNYPQGRITDHRIGMSIFQMENFLNGDLDEMIDNLIAADRAEKLKGEEE